MKLRNICIAVFLLAASSTGVVSAQESDISNNYHPFLSDRFNIGLGVYRPSKDLSFDVGAGGNQENIDGSDSQSTAALNFRWRFTKNWSFQGTYWKVDTEAGATLNENTDPIGDDPPIIFLKGSSLGVGLETEITRLFIGRSFFRRPSTDWGVGAGIHWLQLDAFFQGKVEVDDGMGGTIVKSGRAEASAGVPLPNLGIWYVYSWSPKWVLVTRLDWLDVTVGDISGSMYDASVGVNYQMAKHFGMGLAINAFKLDVSVKDNGFGAGIDTSQVGPRLNITWNW